MSRLLLLALLSLGCESRTTPPPQPPAASLFKSDRVTACAAFARRVEVTLKKAQLPADQAMARDCVESGRVTRANHACLMAAKSSEAVDACFALEGDAGSEPWPTHAADCLAFARHLLGLMTEDLHQTMIESCLAPSMTERDFDCVMNAKTDEAFKGCLGTTK